MRSYYYLQSLFRNQNQGAHAELVQWSILGSHTSPAVQCAALEPLDGQQRALMLLGGMHGVVAAMGLSWQPGVDGQQVEAR